MLDRWMQWMFCWWLALACLATGLRAVEVESGVRGNQAYRVRRWTTDDGLPQNRISCLTQTRDGYLWVGTWFGLARFDGEQFTVFDKYNTPALVNDAINALVEESDGTLWIATADGLVSYRDHCFHRLVAASGLPDRKIWHMAACRSGGVWLQAGSVVTKLRNGKFSEIFPIDTSFNNMIHGLYADSEDSLHIMMGEKWLTLSANGAEPRRNEIRNSSGYTWLTGLPGNEPGTLWLGTQEGLRFWDEHGWKAIEAGEVWHRAVDFIYEDHSSNLWVNTRPGGLYHREGSNWKVVDLGDRAGPVSTICMAEGREGSFWLGTEHGLVRLQQRRAYVYTTRDGLPSDNVWSVCEGKDGTIWLGTDRGLSRIQNGRVVPLATSDSWWNDADRCVLPAADGGVLIAKPRIGLYEFRDIMHLVALAKVLPDANISALYEDQMGRLLVGSGNGVAILKNGQVKAAYTSWAGRSNYDVRCIIEDRAGDFWFGTQGQGLTHMRDGQFEVFTVRDGLSDNHVWSIYEDAAGALWLGTEDGLTRYYRNRFFSFGRSQGLLENSVNWILEDDSGYLWLSGLRGIYRIKREELNAVADGHARIAKVTTFGTADGMESSETNGEGQPAGCKGHDGRLWFPTTLGAVVIDPKRIRMSEAPPLVVIEQVKVDEEIVFGDSAPGSKPDFNLAPGRARSMDISFTANTLEDHKRARFRYRMTGHDSGWREETADRFAHYTNLRPGDYRFEVTAADEHGLWNPRPESIRFSLAPHFYETWVFYFLSGTGAVAGAMGIHFWRVRFLRRIEWLEQQQAVQIERGRIARDLHDELGSRLTALAMRAELGNRNSSEMNSSVQGLLAKESRALAERMRDVIWAVDPECDSLEAFVAYLTEHADEFSGATGIRLRLELPEHLPDMRLSAHARHQLTMVARESLHNVQKHAHATEIKVGLELREGELRLRIGDDGTGLSEPQGRGRGLENMRTRIRAVGGHFQIHSLPARGTTVEARVPLKNLDPDSFMG